MPAARDTQVFSYDELQAAYTDMLDLLNGEAPICNNEPRIGVDFSFRFRLFFGLGWLWSYFFHGANVGQQAAQSDPTVELQVNLDADQRNLVQPLKSQGLVPAQGTAHANGRQQARNKSAPSSCGESAKQEPMITPPYIRIRCVDGIESGRIWSFQEAIHIGRLQSSALCLSDSSVSRTQAVIWTEGKHWWLADWGVAVRCADEKARR